MAHPATTPDHAVDPMLRRFLRVRHFTEELCRPLEIEDYVVQSMPDVSPTRWHLAHTTWFFETFVLAKAIPGYEPFHPRFRYLFNSYYNTIGKQFPRSRRGILTRPTVQEVMAYRRHVDDTIRSVFETDDGRASELRSVLELGTHHEQQHQELILTDIKHVLSQNPLLPTYTDGEEPRAEEAAPLGWVDHEGGQHPIGIEGMNFSFDNEAPRHQALLRPFQLANRLVTNGEFRTFIDDGGYQRPDLWLSEGWERAQGEGWSAPLYWERDVGDDDYQEFTLTGPRRVNPAAPVSHVSYFEADAFARWANARLPTEQEWEIASRGLPIHGNFAEDRRWYPAPIDGANIRLSQMFGDVWEWTASPYVPYPGYRPNSGALGEYNGKFMCNQFVLRGGSHATPRDHIRGTYRNFFPPDARWQITGLRLAR